MFRTIMVGAMLTLTAATADAAEIEVKMLNKGAAGIMVFEPALVKIAPGDTVKFIPTDKSHSAESVPGILPAGTTPFIGKINEEVKVTFAEPGAYGIKCKPHYSMGMVALIVVGEPSNLDTAKAAKHPGRAAKVFAELVERAAQ